MTRVVGVLLAGGRARRMGGGDKCLRTLAGETLLVRAENFRLPGNGSLEGVQAQDVNVAMTETPLRTIQHIVMSGEPYTNIVKTDYVVANEHAAKVWQGRATYATRMARPFVIFGEAIQSEEELLSPGNREVKSYLNQAWLAIARCNERQPDLNAEYVIESQTKDINLYLKKEEGLQWVKAIFLSCSMSRERIGNRAPASYQQGQDAAHIPHLRPEGGYSRFPDDWPQETGNQDREKGQADREDRRSDAVAPGGGS